MRQDSSIRTDARRVIDTVKAGGIALVPNDTGYAFCGSSLEPLRKIFERKKRGSHKRNAMAANLDTQRELHTLDARAQEMVDALVLDHDLPIAVVGTFRVDHPIMSKLNPELLRESSAAGTVALLLNAGTFHNEVCRLSQEEVVPLLGSSANFSGTGTRFRVEDIPQELLSVADVVINHGLRRGHVYKRAGTVINFNTMEVVRIGAFYEMISDVLRRSFNVELPPDPGTDALPSGHLNEFALKDVA
ncbi:Sua5/YciO/YrdC/YwlC family protein [Hydrogenophaga sp.]|uniref:Sua5/YciO/YrdC/YwlC family protein n=1 Tax=Hydrogenophaga sp. TaxID=1904254 RepID=UPI0027271AAE|nr:Sua5/YciO/YrdC/YwlC family protein [Hydrogenophaga sp.]MDO9435395.1 Sua5/YciO/YrdC/YwlC family protein [Hydrogenophaga sp.]